MASDTAASCDPSSPHGKRSWVRCWGLFAGMAAHSIMALEKPLTTGYGLTLGLLGHAVGWPIAKGGAQSVAEALASYLRSLGGLIETGRRIGNLDELPASQGTLLDGAPKSLLGS